MTSAVDLAAAALLGLAAWTGQAALGGRGRAFRLLGALGGGALGGLVLWLAFAALVRGGPLGEGRWRLDPAATDFGSFAARHPVRPAPPRR